MVVTMTPDACHPGGKRRYRLHALHNGRTLGQEPVCLGSQRFWQHVCLRRKHLQNLLGMLAEIGSERRKVRSSHGFWSKGGI